jgi:hypothetical protein
LNVHGVNDVKRTEIHLAERLVPEPSVFEVEMAIEKLKRYKSPGSDQISAELIKAGSRTIRSETHKRIISIRNKEQWPKEWNESINIPIYNKGDTTDCCNYKDIPLFVQYVQDFIHHPAVKANCTCRGNYEGPSVWISTQQVNYSSCILHSLNT